MSALQALLERLETSAYEPECADDMTHHFVPVRGRFYRLDDGRVGVDWLNHEGKYIKQPDGTSTEFYDANVFWDAIEHLGVLRVESISRHGGTVSVRGSDVEHLHGVVEAVRKLAQLFATETARPVI